MASASQDGYIKYWNIKKLEHIFSLSLSSKAEFTFNNCNKNCFKKDIKAFTRLTSTTRKESTVSTSTSFASPQHRTTTQSKFSTFISTKDDET